MRPAQEEERRIVKRYKEKTEEERCPQKDKAGYDKRPFQRECFNSQHSQSDDEKEKQCCKTRYSECAVNEKIG